MEYGENLFFFEAENIYHNGHDECTVMQWTGLVDSKGKDIYEHDIIEIMGERSVVEWVGSGFKVLRNQYFKKDEHAETIRSYVTLDVMNIGIAEVIGNIYENPDLITN